MHEDDLEHRADWSQKVVIAIVRAQVWTRDHLYEASHILAKDNAEHYTPHNYETLGRVLSPGPKWAAQNEASGAIRHHDWNEQRIDFQPYPLPSYTETMVKMLKTTHVSGRNELLKSLDPAFAAHDPGNDRFATNDIASVGGLSDYGLPDSFM